MNTAPVRWSLPPVRMPLVAAFAAGAGTLCLAALGGAAVWALAAGSLVLALTLAGCVATGLRRGRTVFEVTIPGPDGPQSLPVLSIVEQLPDPFILLDGAGSVLLSNRAAHAVIRSAAPGRHISAAIRVPRLLDAVDQVLGGAGTVAVDYSVRVPIERHLRAHVCPIEVPAPPSARRFALIIIHDMTSIRRLEQTRADFVASASHELRTPLASLSGFIETLRGPARNDAAARDKFLDIMEEQARRMARLIGDLLSLSRIELNEHVPPSGTTDLGDVIRDVVDAVEPIARERGVRINAGGLKSGMVTGERDDLVQVFQNLVDNAIKYGGEGGQIVLELHKGVATGPGVPRGPVYSVSVRDFGPGIPREHLPRLTERFYRVDARQSRDAGGTGLGLAIVKHIVSRHGGWLQIDSVRGEGSTFTVHLPSAGPGGDQTQAGSDNPPPVSVRETVPTKPGRGDERPVATVVGKPPPSAR